MYDHFYFGDRQIRCREGLQADAHVCAQTNSSTGAARRSNRSGPVNRTPFNLQLSCDEVALSPCLLDRQMDGPHCFAIASFYLHISQAGASLHQGSQRPVLGGGGCVGGGGGVR